MYKVLAGEVRYWSGVCQDKWSGMSEPTVVNHAQTLRVCDTQSAW